MSERLGHMGLRDSLIGLDYEKRLILNVLRLRGKPLTCDSYTKRDTYTIRVVLRWSAELSELHRFAFARSRNTPVR